MSPIRLRRVAGQLIPGGPSQPINLAKHGIKLEFKSYSGEQNACLNWWMKFKHQLESVKVPQETWGAIVANSLKYEARDFFERMCKQGLDCEEAVQKMVELFDVGKYEELTERYDRIKQMPNESYR